MRGRPASERVSPGRNARLAAAAVTWVEELDLVALRPQVLGVQQVLPNCLEGEPVAARLGAHGALRAVVHLLLQALLAARRRNVLRPRALQRLRQRRRSGTPAAKAAPQRQPRRRRRHSVAEDEGQEAMRSRVGEVDAVDEL